MTSSRRERLIPLLVGLALGVLACEVVVRVGSQSDLDGNQRFGRVWLKPYHVPVRRLEHNLAKYEALPVRSEVYDPDLGWAPHAHTRSHDGIYCYDPDGIRADSIDARHAPTPKPGVLRIELLGDSFTNGAEVPFPRTWGHCLEAELQRRGVQAEVLNLGVRGYGLDQALLRWRKLGRQLHPGLVVLGFQPENMERDQNLIRALYTALDWFPFSKPRFLLEQDSLRLVNVPAVPPESVPGIVAHIGAWPLRPYEGFYHPEDYAAHAWESSRFLALLVGTIDRRWGREAAREASFDSSRSAPGRLALAIIGELRSEVQAAGAQFLVVDLPNRDDMHEFVRGRGIQPDADMLLEMRRRFPMIETAGALRAEADATSLDSLFMPDAHYSPAANRTVGTVVARRIAGPGPGRP